MTATTTLKTTSNDVDVFDGLGVRVYDLDREEFLKVRETLTRVGIKTSDGALEQTCYILHKRGRYALMHHLEMRMLDGERVSMTLDDVAHRNSVASLMDQWGLIEVMDENEVREPRAATGSVAVIPHRDKSRVQLRPLYAIGVVRS